MPRPRCTYADTEALTKPKALSQCGAGSMPTDHESDRLGRIQQDGQVRTCIDLNADLEFFSGTTP
jgi:hypothetical protein